MGRTPQSRYYLNHLKEIHMSRTVDITDDTADSLVKSMLIADYKSVSNNVKTLQEDIDELPDYKLEDLKYDVRLLRGMKIVLGYYLTTDEYLEVVGEPMAD